MASLELSLYLHIPFCTEKCGYCDFYSEPVQNFPQTYIDDLLWETKCRLVEIKPETNAELYVPSLYIGGGTPSLLGGQGISLLLEGLKALAGPFAEITVEANPETADSSFLQSCADHGVTRLSLGVQSFNDNILNAIGRRGRPPGSRAALHERIAEAAHIFGKGLSLDLMSGLPGQSEALLLYDIEKALSYNPGHISLYALSIEEGTPLAKHGKKQGGYFLSEEKKDEFWLIGRDALTKAGFLHYEVSNFAASANFRSVHNIRYWLMKNWLGIGPSASGTIISDDGTGLRRSYAPDAEAFSEAVQARKTPPVVTEKLDVKTVIKETFLMGYRYCEGPDEALFAARFGKTINETIPQTLEKWRQKSGSLPLKETIMNFLNAFLLDVFMELDAQFKF